MPKKSIPKYQQIENYIIDKITTGEYQAHEMLPTESVLSEKFNCSRVTVRQALGNLAYNGHIYKLQGKGSFVTDDKTLQRSHDLTSFHDEVIAMGKTPRTEVQTFNITTPGASVAKLLGIKPNDRIYYIERVRYADNIPMMVERTYMSVDLHPNISVSALESSKYQYADENNLNIVNSFQNISPTFPSAYIAQMLNITEQNPIIRINNTTTLDDGTVFDYTQLFLNNEHYQLNIMRTRK